MTQRILVINAGSSSLKFSVFAADDQASPTLLVGGQIEGLGAVPRFRVSRADGETLIDAPLTAGEDHAGAVRRINEWIEGDLGARKIAVIGHRVVHGGTLFREPVIIDDDAMGALRSLIPLAPLHQPHNLTAIDAMAAAFPGVIQVACFDTAFHRSQPWVADTFALPRDYYERGIRRYGFHGLSYEWIAHELARCAPKLAAGRVVVAHLGNGASCAALEAGRGIASSMGFTALDGLPMGSRSGQIDPGVLLHLLDEGGMTTAELADLLYKRSGLKGLSGISHDLRDLLASGDEAAAQAIDYFTYRIRREVASLAAALQGLDGLVFTAGIGERAATIRADVCHGLAWLGVTLDDAANARHAPIISSPSSDVEVRVMPANEEKMIAQHALSIAG
ncbi:MAG: acetate/propionate family kinase [Alphaproteobacteria bacterium]